MFNNKGQSLILFVIILPILLLIFVLVVDIGRVIVLKQELDNVNEMVLDYGLDNLNLIDNNDLKDELINLVELNKNDIDMIDVRIENNKIYIELDKKIDGIFSSLVEISIFDVESSYVGYMDNNNKRIERVNR